MLEQKKIVLVVDDRRDYRTTISREVRALGFQVEELDSFDSSLKFIESHPFDLAIIDQRLNERNEEDKSGLELAKSIRDKNRKVPIFIITGYGTIDTVTEGRKTNETGQRLVDRYFLKEDKWMEELLEAIKDFLSHD